VQILFSQWKPTLTIEHGIIETEMKNRTRFWQIYLGTVIVALLIVAATIYWNFFGPFRPQDDQLKYASAQLVFTVVAIVGIVFSLLYATHQFAQSQRKPDLTLVFSDSKEESTRLSVPMQARRHHPLGFSIINNGNSVAVWFEVIVNLNNLPGGGPRHSEPSWDSADLHGTIQIKEFTFRSFGRAAAFTSAPLEIGIANLDFNSQDEWQTQYEIPYQINGDWGGPKKGKLLLKVERTEV